MEKEINKAILFDHFGNRTSPIQRKAIEDWLRQPGNEEQYYEWLEEWEREHLQYTPPTEQALAVFFTAGAGTEASADEEESVSSGLPARFRKLLLAAAIVLPVLLALGFYGDELRYRTYRTGYGEVASWLLPDGSRVKLNTNSSLRIPRWGFGSGTREVRLSGEAGFAVKHLPGHRKFVVTTSENFEVEVLGTEFTMTARRSGSRVVLTNGKVSLHYRENNREKALIMKPGELVKLSGNRKPERQQVREPERYSEWDQKRFVFDETTLGEVAVLLREHYGLEVEFREPAITGRTLMGSFRGATADELLQSIAEVLDLSVSRQGNRVQFTTK